MFLERKSDIARVRRLFRSFPIVGILGPRQIGKTTLAKEIARLQGGRTVHSDLERPAIWPAWRIRRWPWRGL